MRNNNLDILKAISAFSVVCIHIKFPGKFGEYINIITALAVPIFFMITGYYYENMKKNGKVEKQIQKLIKLIIFTIIIYVIYGTMVRIFKKLDIKEYYLSIFNVKEMVKFILFNEFPTIGHLWYLPAILYTLLLAGFMTRKNNEKYLKYIVPILFIIYIVTGKYSKIIFGREFSYYYLRRSFIIEGNLYFYLGYFMKKYENRIKISLKTTYLVSMILLIGTYLEMYILEKNNANTVASNYICISILPIFIFICAIKNKREFYIKSVIAKIGKEYSTTIYIIHPLVISILENLNTIELYKYIAPIMVYLLSMVIAISFEKIKKKIGEVNECNIFHR